MQSALRSAFKLSSVFVAALMFAPVASNADNHKATSHPADLSITVKRGDTLNAILTNLLGTYDPWLKVAAYNNLASPYHLSPGDVLTIPASVLIQYSMSGEPGSQRKSNTQVSFVELDPAEANDRQMPATGHSSDDDSGTDSASIIVITPAESRYETSDNTTADDLRVLVKPHDTLSRILIKKTGSFNALREVANYNNLDRPDDLEPGDVLIIPSHLLQRNTSVRNGDRVNVSMRNTVTFSETTPDNAEQNKNEIEAAEQIANDSDTDTAELSWTITTTTNTPESDPGAATALVADDSKVSDDAAEESDASEESNVSDQSDQSKASENTDESSANDESSSSGIISAGDKSAGSQDFIKPGAGTGSEIDFDKDTDSKDAIFEIDGIFAYESERFETTFDDEPSPSRSGSDLIQLKASATLNFTDKSSIQAQLKYKPVDSPDDDEFFYFEDQDFYIPELFYSYENENIELQIGKIDVGDGFLGETSSYFGNHVTSKEYDEKIGINFFGEFGASASTVDYALSAFYDDTTRLSSSLRGLREREELEDDTAARTDRLNNIFAGLAFNFGETGSISFAHIAQSTGQKSFSHQDTWLSFSKTLFDGENTSIELVGDLIHRDNSLEDIRDTSWSAGVFFNRPRSSLFFSVEAEKSPDEFPDDTATFAEVIGVIEFGDNFFIEAAARYEDSITEDTIAYAMALIYYFEFSSSASN